MWRDLLFILRFFLSLPFFWRFFYLFSVKLLTFGMEHSYVARMATDKRGRPPKPADAKVTRRDRFVEAYLRLGSPAQAALVAGYKNPSYGAKIMREEKVKEAIRKISSVSGLKERRTVEEVLSDVIAVGRLAKNRGSYNVALKALELEGRFYGMWADLTHNNEIHVLNIYRERVLKRAEEKAKVITDAEGLVVKKRADRGVIDVSPVAASPAPKAPAQA